MRFPVVLGLAAIAFICHIVDAVSAADSPASGAASPSLSAVLEQPAAIDVDGESLNEVLRQLDQEHGLSIRIDEPELDAIGIDMDEFPVRLTLPAIPLRSVLTWVLHGTDLGWQLQADHILVTSWEKAESYVPISVLDVRDLVQSDGGASYDYDLLIEFIETTVSPETWEVVGGAGMIRTMRGKLILSQQPRIVRQVAGFVERLREAKKIGLGSGDAPPPAPSIQLDPTRSPAIEKALARVGEVRLDGVPLEDGLKALQAKYQIPVILDRVGLEYIGLDAGTPIRFSAESVRLDDALDRMLKDVDLAWYVRDDAVVVTSAEDGECKLETRAYPVMDLLGEYLPVDEFGEDHNEFGFEELIDLATATVDPTSWDIVGGPASAASCPEYGLIVVSQSRSNHRAVEQLLAQLRSEFADRPRISAPPAKPWRDRIRLAVYAFQTPEMEQLQRDANREAREREADEEDESGFGNRPFREYLDPFDDEQEAGEPSPFEDAAEDDYDPFCGPAAGGAYDPFCGPVPQDDDPFKASPREPLKDPFGGPPRPRGEDPFAPPPHESMPDPFDGATDEEDDDPFGGYPSDDISDPFGGPVGDEEEDRFEWEDEEVDAPGDWDEAFMDDDSLPMGGSGGYGGFGWGPYQYVSIAEEDLLNIVTELIEPHTWDDEQFYAKATRGRLLIRHTNAVHKKIRELAERMRVKGFVELGPDPYSLDGVGLGVGMGGGFF